MWWILLVFALIGCGESNSALTARHVDPDVPPLCADDQDPVSTDPRYDCETDEDCTLTCGYGALHTLWAKRLGDTCKDGCRGKAMTARCVDKRCTAFKPDGARDEWCNARPAPAFVCVNNTER